MIPRSTLLPSRASILVAAFARTWSRIPKGRLSQQNRFLILLKKHAFVNRSLLSHQAVGKVRIAQQFNGAHHSRSEVPESRQGHSFSLCVFATSRQGVVRLRVEDRCVGILSSFFPSLPARRDSILSSPQGPTSRSRVGNDGVNLHFHFHLP